MPLTMAEFQAYGKRTVLSPEETADAEAYYQQHRQMNGLGQAHSGDYRDGLNMGAAPVTIMWGAGDRDPQDLRTQDSGFQETVMPGAVNASLSRPRGSVGLERRVALTRMIEELEFLTGTPGVHPRALAQKVWEARRMLMGAGDWSWADYADPRQAYDTKEDLERRLLVIERLLGVGQLAPRLAGLSGLGCCGPLLRAMTGVAGGLGTWGQPYTDPVEKLASCIRGALCMPQSFCCPPGTRFRPRAPRAGGPPPGTWSPPLSETWVPPLQPPSGSGLQVEPPPETWSEAPSETWSPPPPETWSPPPVTQPPPMTQLPPVTTSSAGKLSFVVAPRDSFQTMAQVTAQARSALTPAIAWRRTSAAAPAAAAVQQQAQAAPRAAAPVAQAAPRAVVAAPAPQAASQQARPSTQARPATQARQATQATQARSGAVSASPGAAAMAMRAGGGRLFGLGASSGDPISELRVKLRQARQEIARRRA